MASDRMMQAIGALERAISRLEQKTASVLETTPAQDKPALDAESAQAALTSLDALIAELKGEKHG